MKDSRKYENEQRRQFLLKQGELFSSGKLDNYIEMIMQDYGWNIHQEAIDQFKNLITDSVINNLLWVKDLVTNKDASKFYMSPEAEIELDQRIKELKR
jgi:hypothetical protein